VPEPFAVSIILREVDWSTPLNETAPALPQVLEAQVTTTLFEPVAGATNVHTSKLLPEPVIVCLLVKLTPL
jgi:hypothetical protein